MNRHERRKAQATRKGKAIKPLTNADLRVEAQRITSLTTLSGMTTTARLLHPNEAAAQGREIAALAHSIAALADGSPEQQQVVREQIVRVNLLLNGVRYAEKTVPLRIAHCMQDEPPPARLVPDEPGPATDRWRSASLRHAEQTALARGLVEACVPVLGVARAYGLAGELLERREGNPARMLLPPQRRDGTRDNQFRSSLKCWAVQRYIFDAAVEGVPRVAILRRANGDDGADLIDPRTFENWIAETDPCDIALAEQIGLAVKEGRGAALPIALLHRLAQLQAQSFVEWVRLALAAR